jgi:7-cyano-7-deazaguanine synthase
MLGRAFALKGQPMHIPIFSGGMDSFTLTNDLVNQHGADQVTAISFDYGQRHKRELTYAIAEAKRLGIAHKVVDITMLRSLMQGSALTSAEIPVPEGHYAEESMKITVVPGRNTLMLSIAMAYAESVAMQTGDADQTIYFGVHQGDHAIYPDCRADYFEAMRKTMELATAGKVTLRAPYLFMDKAAILWRGREIGLTAKDYARSWTCYKGLAEPCGKCGACVERAEAFEAVGWKEG